MCRQQAIAAKAELRNRIEQEEKNSKMNRLKIQNQWRKIMRLAKVTQEEEVGKIQNKNGLNLSYEISGNGKRGDRGETYQGGELYLSAESQRCGWIQRRPGSVTDHQDC